jgi:hypothetical protein
MVELVPSRAHGGIFAFVEVACLPNYRGGFNNGWTCFWLGLWGHFNICRGQSFVKLSGRFQRWLTSFLSQVHGRPSNG